MSVNIVEGIRSLVDKGADYLTEEMVSDASANAPIDTGQLSSSIYKMKVGVGEYIISTNAYGENGFEYPARIEAGQGVVATRKSVLHFWAHGNEVFAKSAGPTSQPHFMRKTVEKYGGH